jgi:aspartate aminotransferase
MDLSIKINNITESGTIKFTPILKKLRAGGKDIISFSVGELDFDTPQDIINATRKALDEKRTRYDASSGIKELKIEICQKLHRDNHIGCSEENIIVSNGSKQSLYSAFQVLLNPNDEVIVPVPYWVTYSEQIKCADGNPVFADTYGFHLDAAKIEECITDKTKAIVINSPNNPSGAVYRKNDLKKIADLALAHDLFIISDEPYEKIIYDGETHNSISSFNDEIKERTITINSFSKTYAMTGFRVGYMCAPLDIIKQVDKFQGHLTGNVCTFAQYGAIAALNMDQSFLHDWIKELQARRDYAYKRAKELFDCEKPRGAFYLFPNVSTVLNNKKQSSEELCSDILEKANVAVIPGDTFGMKNHIRISYACPMQKLEEGFDRMEKIL